MTAWPGFGITCRDAVTDPPSFTDFRNLSLLAGGAGQLALGAVALIRGKPSSLSVPLGLLSLSMFGWCFATLAYGFTQDPIWNAADLLLSSLCPALVLHFVLAFVGRVRRYRWFAWWSYAAFGLLGLVSSASALGTPMPASQWSTLFLALWLPTFAVEIVLLREHFRQADERERARTRLVVAALVLGALTVSTDVLNDFELPLPSLGGLGSALASGLALVATLRFNLLEGTAARPALVYTGTVAAIAVIVQSLLLSVAREHSALLIFGAAIVISGALFLVREAYTSGSEQRAKTHELYSMGRVSAQMAHDLLNPLAALSGALQLLDERATPEQREHFVRLAQAQTTRLRCIIDTYRRLAKVEPLRSLVDLNQLATTTAKNAALDSRGVSLALELDETIGALSLDPELITSCLENLIENALDAMSAGGTLTLKSSKAGEPAPEVALEVADTGSGMDARIAERALDDFFTTKANGSGLGLALVRRVVEAHGGRVVLTSRVGAGTRVSLRFPAP